MGEEEREEERRRVTARGKGLVEAGLLRGLSFQVRVCACFRPDRDGRDVDCPKRGSLEEKEQRQSTGV